MQFCLCVETFFFCIGSFLLLTHGFFAMRKHLQAGGWCAFRDQCATLLKTVVGWTSICIELFQLSCAPRDVLLTEKLSQRRLEAMHNAILTVTGMTSTLIAGILVRMALGAEAGRSDSQLLCVVAVSALSICASYMLVLTSALLEIYYAIMMLLCSYFVWSSTADTFFFVACATFVIQLVLSVHFMNMRSVAFWNLVVMSVEIVYAMQHPPQALTRNIFLYLIALNALIIFATLSGRCQPPRTARL
eukprot:TRINITY_DN10539_c0_g2_i1.p1 TRINITY_DN10539_c0_g2~~TRINITY_DN10539_c0_g2_i1.p1  ORF type:complete len:265 (+),score=20.15 TRINITY_DN10539_c0_g2_i1:59-796(+)